jgi:hypothetical protein
VPEDGRAIVRQMDGMITGRLGYALGPTLIYIKGGAAFVPVQASVLDQCALIAAGCGNWLISTSDSHTITTGTLGGGVEWAFASSGRAARRLAGVCPGVATAALHRSAASVRPTPDDVALSVFGRLAGPSYPHGLNG